MADYDDTLEVRVLMQRILGDPVVNVLHFLVPPGFAFNGPNVAPLQGVVLNLYAAIGANLSGNLLNFFQLTVTDLRSTPRMSIELGAQAYRSSSPGGIGLPDQVALACTILTGTPSRRGRGRVFLGPWTAASNVAGSGVPSSTVTSAVLSGMQSMREDGATESFFLGVLSRVDGLTRVAQEERCGNIWDTMRSRAYRPETYLTS